VNRVLNIDNVLIDDASEAYVIAEIGHNHQGSVEQAKAMISAAKLAGATAVKFQKRDNRNLYTDELYFKAYENENSFGATYGEHREFLEFGSSEYEELMACARAVGISCFATPFDFRSVDFLAHLDVPAYKIASGDIRNTPLIRHVARVGKPIIISTGAATLDDVQRAFDAAVEINEQVALLQCTAAYPVAFEEMDLNVLLTYRQKFPNTVVGLSAHDNGIAMSVVAYVLGARIIEKHFTLNRAMKGTDHAFSLVPSGMHRMVRDLNRARVALGCQNKRIHPSEYPALGKMGKKLVAARDLLAGHVLRSENVAIKSPGGGMHPFELPTLLGKVLKRAVKRDEAFAESDVILLRAAG